MCGINQYSAAGASVCIDCPPGQWANAGSVSCTPLCPTGWTYYNDSSGVEGHDSCVLLSSAGVPWTSAAAACRSVTFTDRLSSTAECQLWLGYVRSLCVARSAAATGAHMLTSAQPNKTAPGLYSFVVAMWGTNLFAVGASWPGDTNSADKGWGQWAWVDGTNASNLNCYSGGCGLWMR